MPRILRQILFLVLAVLLLAAAGCEKKAPPPPDLTATKTLAVAGFSNPQHQWELLAGCTPSTCTLVKPEVLVKLNQVLADDLTAAGKAFVPRNAVSGCQETAKLGQYSGSQQAQALSYWLEVGRCVGTDYLLVPQLMAYRERVGGEWGVQQPASVVMYVYLIDVANGGIARRFAFDEKQQALSENLLDLGKFVDRGGKWITAEQMADEAIAESLRSLGLGAPEQTGTAKTGTGQAQ
ncbi:putative lipoprotein [Desulfovibrio sp. X2]|uniref:hypothetical protein n=1 Tax=Desulfovibrio sp. X2 TaxID=941449 RepID=UPI000358C36E|nr:hypothetical protein [Desulfovibrio sp. X2]EPR42815.1 putative lipoprotein [Desulfovibrio sp. X2]